MKNNRRPVVLITGAAKNTGYAVAERFAQEGYNVAITSREIDKAKASSQMIKEKYPQIDVEGYKLLPSDTEQINQVFSNVKQRFGRLDVFVANATAPGYRNILSATPNDYDFVMNSNAKAYFFCSQAAAKIMIEEGGGCIVLIGSVNGVRPLPNKILYAASKAAIHSFNRSIAIELAKYGIRCNCVVAGAIWNDRWENFSKEEITKKRSNWPLGRESQPMDIANMVYFLASEQANTITGAEFTVDSGLSATIVKYNENWDKE